MVFDYCWSSFASANKFQVFALQLILCSQLTPKIPPTWRRDCLFSSVHPVRRNRFALLRDAWSAGHFRIGQPW